MYQTFSLVYLYLLSLDTSGILYMYKSFGHRFRQGSIRTYKSYGCLDSSLKSPLKGQYHEIVLLRFYLKLLLPVPLDKSRNKLDFFWLFAEIFDFSVTSPVSKTPAKHKLPTSLTTGEESLTGVNNTSKWCFCSLNLLLYCQWHRWGISQQCQWHW